MPGTKDELDTAVKTDTVEFDKAKQRADQEAANARKAREAAEAERGRAAAAEAEAARLRQQISDLQKQASAEKTVTDALPDVDVENASIEDLTKYVKAATKVIAEQGKKLASVETRVDRSAEETAQERQAKVMKDRANAALNEVCDDLDREFGAEHRNAAIELMEKRNAEEGLPGASYKAVLRLRDCYKAVASEAKKSEPKKSARRPVDTGGGGVRPAFGGKQVRKGTLAEVMGQLKGSS